MSEESKANQPQNAHVNSEAEAHQKMVRGSAWMTAGSLFSRVLGAIYIIPWVIWMGADYTQGNALYAKGYNIYSFFLLIAIGGIPSAISKQLSEYNAMNEYAVGQRLFKRGLLLTSAFGIIGAIILWFGAGLISTAFGGYDANLIPVLHALAIALVILPSMSLTRGFFQGYQQMAPSAISQFVEQVFRVIYVGCDVFHHARRSRRLGECRDPIDIRSIRRGGCQLLITRLVLFPQTARAKCLSCSEWEQTSYSSLAIVPRYYYSGDSIYCDRYRDDSLQPVGSSNVPTDDAAGLPFGY